MKCSAGSCPRYRQAVEKDYVFAPALFTGGPYRRRIFSCFSPNFVHFCYFLPCIEIKWPKSEEKFEFWGIS